MDARIFKIFSYTMLLNDQQLTQFLSQLSTPDPGSLSLQPCMTRVDT